MLGWLFSRNKPRVLSSQQIIQLSAATLHVEDFGAVTWQPQHTILQALEGANIPVRHSCRSGNCGACQAFVVSGDIAYLKDISFKVEAGAFLMCAAVPIGDVTLSLSARAVKRVKS